MGGGECQGEIERRRENVYGVQETEVGIGIGIGVGVYVERTCAINVPWASKNSPKLYQLSEAWSY